MSTVIFFDLLRKFYSKFSFHRTTNSHQSFPGVPSGEQRLRQVVLQSGELRRPLLDERVMLLSRIVLAEEPEGGDAQQAAPPLSQTILAQHLLPVLQRQHFVGELDRFLHRHAVHDQLGVAEDVADLRTLEGPLVVGSIARFIRRRVGTRFRFRRVLLLLPAAALGRRVLRHFVLTRAGPDEALNRLLQQMLAIIAQHVRQRVRLVAELAEH